jgi:hypothetical protein
MASHCVNVCLYNPLITSHSPCRFKVIKNSIISYSSKLFLGVSNGTLHGILKTRCIADPREEYAYTDDDCGSMRKCGNNGHDVM